MTINIPLVQQLITSIPEPLCCAQMRHCNKAPASLTILMITPYSPSFSPVHNEARDKSYG
jgi:hypothetical protein